MREPDDKEIKRLLTEIEFAADDVSEFPDWERGRRFMLLSTVPLAIVVLSLAFCRVVSWSGAFFLLVLVALTAGTIGAFRIKKKNNP